MTCEAAVALASNGKASASIKTELFIETPAQILRTRRGLKGSNKIDPYDRKHLFPNRENFQNGTYVFQNGTASEKFMRLKLRLLLTCCMIPRAPKLYISTLGTLGKDVLCQQALWI